MKVLLVLVSILFFFSGSTMAAKGGKSGKGGGGNTTSHTIQVPANITSEAASSGGATVSFTVTATDGRGSSVSYSCLPTSGSVFPLGTTIVSCNTEGKKQSRVSDSFTVTVEDTVAPRLWMPLMVVEESMDGNAVPITYSVSAEDVVDGALSVSCTPASGSAFSVGDHMVSCASEDGQGNLAEGSFAVVVEQGVVATPDPELFLPGDIAVESEETDGAFVTFQVSTIPNGLNVSCIPASGSLFVLGETPVNCTAIDSEQRTISGSFLVVVTSAPVEPPKSSVKLSWTIPDTREDGSQLLLSDIAGYRIYQAAELNDNNQVVAIDDPSVTSVSLGDLASDTYHFSISTIDVYGLESNPSEVISIVVSGG